MEKKKVLVVDDSEIVLVMAREALEEGGFEVQTCMSALGIDKYVLGKDRPDVIILDVMLPVLDGDKKAKMLKGNDLTRNIPIILLSSKPEDELRLLVKVSGSDGYFRKPFGKSQLVAKVQEVLDAI